jgi:hypothetical protein
MAKHSLKSAGSLQMQPTVTEAEAVKTVIGAVLGAPLIHKRGDDPGGFRMTSKQLTASKTFGAFFEVHISTAPVWESRRVFVGRNRVYSLLNAE